MASNLESYMTIVALSIMSLLILVGVGQVRLVLAGCSKQDALY